MGIDVELLAVVQAGTSPRRRRTEVRAEVGDPNDVFAQLLDRVCHRGVTPMLDRIDRYGTLQLASLDMEQFLHELKRVRCATRTRDEEDILNRIEQLAQECRTNAQTVILFSGD